MTSRLASQLAAYGPRDGGGQGGEGGGGGTPAATANTPRAL